MKYIMKYRPKSSNNEWQYHEDGSKQRCLDLLTMSEHKEDYEYRIYEFLEEGVAIGLEDEDSSFETELDYLFAVYDCNDIDTLKARCPIDLNLLDLKSEATEEFKEAVNRIEVKENEEIYKIIKEREEADTTETYSFEDFRRFKEERKK